MALDRFVSVYMQLTKKGWSTSEEKVVPLREIGLQTISYNICKQKPVPLNQLAREVVVLVIEFYANATGMSPEQLNEQIELFKREVETLEFVMEGV